MLAKGFRFNPGNARCLNVCRKLKLLGRGLHSKKVSNRQGMSRRRYFDRQLTVCDLFWLNQRRAWRGIFIHRCVCVRVCVCMYASVCVCMCVLFTPGVSYKVLIARSNIMTSHIKQPQDPPLQQSSLHYFHFTLSDALMTLNLDHAKFKKFHSDTLWCVQSCHRYFCLFNSFESYLALHNNLWHI